MPPLATGLRFLRKVTVWLLLQKPVAKNGIVLSLFSLLIIPHHQTNVKNLRLNIVLPLDKRLKVCYYIDTLNNI